MTRTIAQELWVQCFVPDHLSGAISVSWNTAQGGTHTVSPPRHHSKRVPHARKRQTFPQTITTACNGGLWKCKVLRIKASSTMYGHPSVWRVYLPHKKRGHYLVLGKVAKKGVQTGGTVPTDRIHIWDPKYDILIMLWSFLWDSGQHISI